VNPLWGWGAIKGGVYSLADALKGGRTIYRSGEGKKEGDHRFPSPVKKGRRGGHCTEILRKTGEGGFASSPLRKAIYRSHTTIGEPRIGLDLQGGRKKKRDRQGSVEKGGLFAKQGGRGISILLVRMGRGSSCGLSSPIRERGSRGLSRGKARKRKQKLFHPF